jgi:hypothetical protein
MPPRYLAHPEAARTRWLSMLFTSTSRYHPLRTTWASTGGARAHSSWTNQGASAPRSRPTRLSENVRFASVCAIASGASHSSRAGHQPRSSTTQTAVLACDMGARQRWLWQFSCSVDAIESWAQSARVCPMCAS